MNLLILGAGGYEQVVKAIAEAMGVFDRIEFLDDDPNSNVAIGKCIDFENYAMEFQRMIPAFCDNRLRMMWIERLETSAIIIPSIIHPHAFLSPTACVYPGSIVEPLAVLNNNSYVEKGCIVRIGALVDHDSFIGYGSYISSGAIVKANSIVRAMSSIESGTITTPNENPTTEELLDI